MFPALSVDGAKKCHSMSPCHHNKTADNFAEIRKYQQTTNQSLFYKKKKMTEYLKNVHEIFKLVIGSKEN